ncbi:MAG: nitrate transporter substrate-binding protein [Betaproteobacteria bacterium]|nr:nitrate transporter substrate-binding protein [Betaproteobacteria bacterium]
MQIPKLSVRRLVPLFALACAALLQPAAAAELRKTKVTIPVTVLNFYPLYAGVEKGYFAKEGLDLEIISTSGDGPDVDALISGSVDFTVSTPNRLMTSHAQGKPLLGIMNVGNRMSMECFMNKEIATGLGVSLQMPLDKRLAALKGLTLAGTRPGAFSYLLPLSYAKRAGYVPQKDVQLVGVGGGPGMIAAVENKNVAVACGASPLIEMAVARGKSVVFTENIRGVDPAFENFLYEVLYVRPDFAAKEPETVRKMIRGLLAAIKFIQTAPDAEQLPIMKKYFGGAPDDILLQALSTTKLGFRADGRITDEAVKKAADFLIQTGAITSAPAAKDITSNAFLP